jgi:hypothetical protein
LSAPRFSPYHTHTPSGSWILTPLAPPFAAPNGRLEQLSELIMSYRINTVLVKDFYDREDLSGSVDPTGSRIGFGSGIECA